MTALATIAPFLDDIIRGLTLGGGIDTTVSPAPLPAHGPRSVPADRPVDDGWSVLATQAGAGDRITTPVNFTRRTLLAFLVAFVLGVPLILVALQPGASDWSLTAATTPAMLVDRDGFYGPRQH